MRHVDFVEEVKGTGSLQLQDGRKYPITLALHYSKYSGEKLDVSGLFPQGDWFNYLGITSDSISGVSAEAHADTVLRLTNPLVSRLHGREIDFRCTGFTLGTEDSLPFDSGNYYIQVQIPFSPLVQVLQIPTRSALGTIESKRGWEEGIAWDSPLGKFLAADFYHWEQPDNKESLTRIKVAEIRAKGTITESVTPPSVVEKTEGLIREPLILLSFLGRRFLHWYEIRVAFRPPEKSEYRTLEFLKRRRIERDETSGVEPLLHNSHLADGSFGPLLDQLKSSPIKDWLHKAMIYAVSSYHEPTVETQIAMIYLATEALTEGFAQQRGISNALPIEQSRELTGRLQSAVHEFCADMSIDNRTKQQLLGKLQGFARSSLKRRLVELISRTKIKTDDLWPDKIGLSKGLQALVDRRNDFIHRAQIEGQVWTLVKDLFRLQAIVERSILELLGWDSTCVHPSAYSRNYLLTQAP